MAGKARRQERPAGHRAVRKQRENSKWNLPGKSHGPPPVTHFLQQRHLKGSMLSQRQPPDRSQVFAHRSLWGLGHFPAWEFNPDRAQSPGTLTLSNLSSHSQRPLLDACLVSGGCMLVCLGIALGVLTPSSPSVV